MNHKNICVIVALVALIYSGGYAMDQITPKDIGLAEQFIEKLNDYIDISENEAAPELKEGLRVSKIYSLSFSLTHNNNFKNILAKNAPVPTKTLLDYSNEEITEDNKQGTTQSWIKQTNIEGGNELKKAAYEIFLSDKSPQKICAISLEQINHFRTHNPVIMRDNLKIILPILIRSHQTHQDLSMSTNPITPPELSKARTILHQNDYLTKIDEIHELIAAACRHISPSEEQILSDTSDNDASDDLSFSMSSTEFNDNALSSSTLFASSLNQSGFLNTTDQTSDPDDLFMQAHEGTASLLNFALVSGEDSAWNKKDLENIVINIKTMIGYIIENDLSEEKQKNPISSYRIYQLTAAQKMFEDVISHETENNQILKDILKALKEEIDAVYTVTKKNVGLREKGEIPSVESSIAVGKAVRAQQREEKKEKQREDFVAKLRKAAEDTKESGWLKNDAKKQIAYLNTTTLSAAEKIYILQLLWFQIQQNKVDIDHVDTSNINDARMGEYNKEIKKLGSSISLTIKGSPLFPYPEFKNIPKISEIVDPVLQKFIEDEQKRIVLARELTTSSQQIEQTVFNRAFLQQYKNALEKYKSSISPSEISLSEKINRIINETDKKLTTLKKLSRLKVVSRKKVVLPPEKMAAGRVIMEEAKQELISKNFQQKADQILKDIAASQKEVLDAQAAQNKRMQELFAQQENKKIELEEENRKKVEAARRLYDEKAEAIKEKSINEQISLKKQNFETLIKEKGISIICSNDIFKNATGINLLALIQVLKEKLETIKISSDDQSLISLVPGWIAILESSFAQGINIEKSDELKTAIDSICKVRQTLFPIPQIISSPEPSQSSIPNQPTPQKPIVAPKLEIVPYTDPALMQQSLLETVKQYTEAETAKRHAEISLKKQELQRSIDENKPSILCNKELYDSFPDTQSIACIELLIKELEKELQSIQEEEEDPNKDKLIESIPTDIGLLRGIANKSREKVIQKKELAEFDFDIAKLATIQICEKSKKLFDDRAISKDKGLQAKYNMMEPFQLFGQGVADAYNVIKSRIGAFFNWFSSLRFGG